MFNAWKAAELRTDSKDEKMVAEPENQQVTSEL